MPLDAGQVEEEQLLEAGSQKLKLLHCFACVLFVLDLLLHAVRPLLATSGAEARAGAWPAELCPSAGLVLLLRLLERERVELAAGRGLPQHAR